MSAAGQDVAGASADNPSDEVISVITYFWAGSREFKPGYVDALARAVKHYLPEPHRFICITDSTKAFCKHVEVLPEPPAVKALGHLQTLEKAKFPSSYRRLWTFSEEARMLGERVLLLDIDCMVVSSLLPLFKMKDDFVGWNVRPPPGGPPRFGGGTWLLRTGTRTWVYDRFIADPAAAMATAREAGYRGSDQAWISYCLRKTEPCWPEPSGIFCVQDYRKHTSVRVQRVSSRLKRPLPSYYRRRGEALVFPPNAVVLHMNGADTSGKPWNSSDPLVAKYWRPFYDGIHAR